MNEYIAYCGLNCEACEARLATVNNDGVLRQRVAREWSELNGVEITAEMINYSGCRIPGVKTLHCYSLCPIRQCAMGKQMKTCGSCPEMEFCEKLAMITGNNADALRTPLLKSAKKYWRIGWQPIRRITIITGQLS